MSEAGEAKASDGGARAARRRAPWRGVVLVLLGLVGGWWIARSWAPSGGGVSPSASTASPSDEEQAGADTQLYTCGMHPNVIQEGPGECPICHMKLTPLESDKAKPAAGASGAGAKTAEGGKRKILYWRAPMDPSYTSDRPGKSPMGMDLVPVYADEVASSANVIRIDPVTVQNMGIRTDRVRRGPLVGTVRTVGRVDYDEQRVTFVDTKFSGWIEKLFVDETGQKVERGDPLFSVYSPELYAAEEEYLSALRTAPSLARSDNEQVRAEAQRLIEAAERKLRYLDVTEEQIRELRERGEPDKVLTMRSPARGIVTEKMALEGMYVKPGMRLYTIADLDRVWVYVDVYEYQLPWVRLGQNAEMELSYIPGKRYTGKVIYIYPYLDERLRVVRVRLEFDNPELELKPGMYATVTLRSELKSDALLIPREAYIDTGKRQIAFVALGEGKFDPREIEVGVETEDGEVEVRKGLEEGERIVVSGQFLLDAESKVREAIRKMLEARKKSKAKGGEAAPPSSEAVAGVPSHEHGAKQPVPGPYACPMEEHPGEERPEDRGPYFADAPGRCPRCGMELVPSETLPWAKAMLERARAATATAQPAPGPYACPMEEHPGEERAEDRGPYFADAPGRCPRCGMELVPSETLPWAKAMLGRAAAQAATATAGETAQDYTCPMHPDKVHAGRPGRCPICGMQLVRRDSLAASASGVRRTRRLVDNIFEHYLQLWDHLASDRSDEPEVVRNVLGFVAAAKDLAQRAREPDGPKELAEIAERLQRAALQLQGRSLERDRAAFVEVSAAVRALIDRVRPSRERWPKLWIFHCPMTKADWIQDRPEPRNPYYGFQRLECAELRETR